MEPRRFDLNELLTKGILQEVNRKFFHPLGLALSVVVEEKTGKVKSLGPIYETPDPDGWFFGVIDASKATAFREWASKRAPEREKMHGFVVQGDSDTIKENQ